MEPKNRRSPWRQTPLKVLSCVDGSVYARFFSTDVDRYEERSCVRPVGAVYITAGLDEVRVPGP